MNPSQASLLRGVLAGLALALAVAPVRATPDDAPPEPRRRALLVGVESYPDSTGWPKLAGPLADVAVMRQALVDRGGFRASDVHVLLDEQATRAAILEQFALMVGASAPDDVLFFYFAGHGSRLPDPSGDEPDGWDETLVPFDAKTADGRPNDILDDEMGGLIAVANEVTDHVVLVFDCCSSGTVVRSGGTPGRRFVDPALRTEVRALMDEDEGDAVSPGTRGLAGVRKQQGRGVGSDYFPPERDLRYVMLSACRSDESAHEYAVPGEPDRVHGLFTYSFVRQMYGLKPGMSYLDLGDRVRRDVASLRPHQTPVVEGALAEAALFRGGAVSQVPFHPVTREAGGWVLNAGRMAGLSPLAIFNVCEEGTERDADQHRLGRIQLTDVGVATSRFEWMSGGIPSDVSGRETFRAFLVRHGQEAPPMGVAVVADAADSRDLRRALERSGNVRLAALADADLLVALGEDGVWEVASRTGIVLPLRARADSSEEVGRLAQGLSGLGAARRVESAIRNEEGGDLDIEASLVLVDGKGNDLGELSRDPDGVLMVQEGQHVSYRLRNRSAVPVYAALLLISPDGQVAKVWSTRSVDDAIPPDESWGTPPLEMQMPEGAAPFYALDTECFRWVVTTDHAHLRALDRLSQEACTVTTTLRGGSVIDPTSEPGPVDAWVTRTVRVRMVGAGP